MPIFSKFIVSQRGCQQLVDSDGHIYSNKKSHNTEFSSSWRCSKYNPPVKCNMVEGFHRGFRTRISKAKPSVQSYFKAIREQQVLTDFHIDRLEGGITPTKRRRVDHGGLADICKRFSEYDNRMTYLFAIASYFGHDVEE